MDWDEFYKWLKGKIWFQIFIVGITGALMLLAYAMSRKTSSPSPATAGKRAIALSEDKTSVSPTFARAPYFKIDSKIVKNPHAESFPAGPKTAEWLASMGVKEVVAGNFGSIALKKLEELGIKAKTAWEAV